MCAFVPVMRIICSANCLVGIDDDRLLIFTGSKVAYRRSKIPSDKSDTKQNERVCEPLRRQSGTGASPDSEGVAAIDDAIDIDVRPEIRCIGRLTRAAARLQGVAAVDDAVAVRIPRQEAHAQGSVGQRLRETVRDSAEGKADRLSVVYAG